MFNNNQDHHIVTTNAQTKSKPITKPTGTMQAVRFYEPTDVRYETVPIPELKPGELLVRVDVSLTCGTDVKCYRRGHPVLLKDFPAPFGHEFAGTVVNTANDVTSFLAGDRIVSANSAPCFECYFCKQSQTNLCDNLDLLNGSYADYMVIPANIVAHNTYTIPNSMDSTLAAFSEDVAIALRGVEMSGITKELKENCHNKTVAVIGLGTIGQLICRIAKHYGATVTALGRSEYKRTLASTFAKADVVIDMTEVSDPSDILKNYSPDGRGFDVVIEAVGQPSTWELALQLVRKGGLVNWFGGCPSGSTVNIDTRRVHYDEITLISLFHHTPMYYQKALALLNENAFDPRVLISETLPMADFEKALLMMEQGEAMKIALHNNHL